MQSILPFYSDQFSVFCAGFLLCMISLLFKVVYNRYFHPLAGYPGPFWATVTDFYKFYTINSIPTLGLKLHDTYGPIVRIAPNLLSFSDPVLLPEVYHGRANKSSFYSSWLFGNTSSMFLTLGHDEHAAKSKIVSPCCSLKALKQFEGDIDERITELCDKIKQKSASGEAIDFAEYTRWFLADTFGHLAYGEPPGCISQGRDAGGLIHALQSIYSMAGTVAVLPWLLMPLMRNKLFQNLVMPHLTAVKGLEKLKDHYKDMLSKRARTPHLKERHCFFDSLSKPRGNHDYTHTFNSAEIEAEVITFTSAALDGLAAFISPFVDRISQNPSIYSTLMAEIISAEQRGAFSIPIVQYDQTTDLPYFMACVNETLRLESPAQTILPRYISPGGLDLGSSIVPAGAEMAASPFIIHRNQTIFGEDAHVFRPERWLESKERSQRMEKYGMWWGYGDRKCAGKNFAQLQMQKLCLQLFREFEIVTAMPEKRFRHERWAVGMFWDQSLRFRERKMSAAVPLART